MANPLPSLNRTDARLLDPGASFGAEVGATHSEAVPWSHVQGSVLFSSCNEDSESEIQALVPSRSKRLLCVTAGGGRVLNLISERPAEIWAVDLNPAQNHLLELKVAAIQALEHGAFLGFMGVRPSPRRLDVYNDLRPRLSTACVRFFDQNPLLIDRGILLEGKLERFLRGISRLLRATSPFGLRRLFEHGDLARQQRFVAQLDRSAFRLVARNIARRWVLEVFSGDPGFYRFLPPDLPLHHAIYDSVIRYLSSQLPRSNHLLSLVFFGRYIDEGALPRYLNARWYGLTRDALHKTRLRVITGCVDDVLASAGERRFDAFSLSDISSYLDNPGWTRLMDRVFASAEPGARICSRGCLVHRPLDPEHQALLVRDEPLERMLGDRDHAMVHRFLVGERAR